MTCCLEDALLTALRGIDGTPILAKNHFIGRRTCEDCVPYLVAKVSTISGLKTSEGTQKKSSVAISAYFGSDNQSQLTAYKTLIEDMFFGQTCVEFSDCGCFCLQGAMRSSTDPVAGNMTKFSFSFEGLYKQFAASESV